MLLLSAHRTEATTIGTFFYDADFFGPTFLIENISDQTLPTGGTFSDVTVQLFLGGAPVDFPLSVLMSDLPVSGAPNYQQGSTTDFIDPASFDSAILMLQFSLPGIITVGPMTGFVDGIRNGGPVPIDFVAQEDNVPVPEPATIVMVGAGLGLFARRRNRRSSV